MKSFAVSALIFVLPALAQAARPVADHPGADLVLASGAAARANPRAAFSPPADHPAWRAFEAAMGGTWHAVWDTDTGVPLRIWGSGVDAPGATASAADAERVARQVLADHVALLAPGARAEDFEVASNTLSRGVRSVGFLQTRHGLRVDGGQVSFRFKYDRLVALGSEALPNLDSRKLTARVSAALAKDNAKKWLALELGDAGVVESVEGPLVRAIVLEDGGLAERVVVRVLVRTRRPVGRWAVDLDAATGAPFARRQTLLFGAGQVVYEVPQRRPGAGSIEAPAAFANVTVGGAMQQLDVDGVISWTAGATVTLEASTVGRAVEVATEAGALAKAELVVPDGGRVVWNADDDEWTAAQLNAFVHGYKVREYVRIVAPNLRFLDEPVQATVNIDDQCNAYSDGTGIFFFRSSNMCENTGRLPDVVHHEYGHSVHAHAIIQGVGSFDSALSEGISDYLAATIVSDAGMGRGFFYSDEPLRDLNPVGREWRWPDDQGESHQTGQIIGGALWDLRELFRGKFGDEEGVRRVDGFWFSALERASNILAVYPEILVDDDDDGNLANGTPNLCEITEIFRRAGLTDGTQAGLRIGDPVLERGQVYQMISAQGLCPGLDFDKATLTWGRRGQPDVGGAIEMAYAEGIAWADLPLQPEGEVMLYKVVIELTNGEQLSFPDNPADPMYEVFVGQVRQIYCNDFEADPMASGWITELLPSESRRPRNEWEWGRPVGSGGDPTEAFSGNSVIGNDLTGNGSYQGRKSEQLISPTIDVSGASNVRLQYRRWLGVEDGDADQAQILVGEQVVWSNLASGTGEVHHEDKEWRFHDVDLTDVAAANGGQLQVSFRISSDRFGSFGGWTIDDFCIVAWDGPTAACGDGALDFGEACDDGNLDGRDGCEADCTLTPPPACGDGFVDPGEACDDGNLTDGDGCEASCQPTMQALDPVKDGLDADEGCRCVATDGSGLFGLLLLGLLGLRRRR